MWRAELKESCLMALNAIAAHKLRSALTLLGVLVGVDVTVGVHTAMTGPAEEHSAKQH